MYEFLANKVIFPIGDKLLGTHIISILKEEEEKQWWSPEKIQEEQNIKLQKLIKHAYGNIPYWRSLFDSLGLKPKHIQMKEDLPKLPILTKGVIRKNTASMLAQNFPKKRFIEQHSSGSTGEPLKYYLDKRQLSYRWTSNLRYWRWAGFTPGKKWACVHFGYHNSIVQKLFDKSVRCLFLPFLGINREELATFTKRLMRFNPEVIRGYASALFVLAKHLHDNKINNIRPKSIITTGDILFPHYRNLIEKQFNCKVYDTYGGEGMSIAGQCEKGNYHIDDNNVIIEFIKDDGNPSIPGELANIIATDLNNYVMSFIRYQIGDIGRPLDGICPCGRGLSLMESIEGRDTDVVICPNGGYLIVHSFTGLFEYIEGVEQFQVIQEIPNEILIKIIKNDNFTNRDATYIKDTITREGGGLKVNLEFVEDIPVARSGKRRFVISKIGETVL